MLSSISVNQPDFRGLQQLPPEKTSQQPQTEKINGKASEKEPESPASSPKSSIDKQQQDFSVQELKKIESLKARDREVKTHEMAHLSAAGGFALGGSSFRYQTGPNGVRYAVAGEVPIDISAVQGDPQATMQKAETIRKAALAPTNPSAQDQRIASKASVMSAKASAELMQLSQQQDNPGGGEKQSTNVHIDISV
jgi:SprA-related family